MRLTGDKKASSPQMNIQSVQYSDQRETPRDTLDDGVMAFLRKLVDDRAKQQKMYERPICNIVSIPGCGFKVRIYQARKDQGAGVMYVTFPL